MNKSIEPVLLTNAPLNCTHWKKNADTYVRMGDACVDGYVKLNDVRRAVSISILRAIDDFCFLKRVADEAPATAIAYSIHSGNYLTQKMADLAVIRPNGVIRPVMSYTDIKSLIYLDHLRVRLIDITIQAGQKKPWNVLGS